MLSSQNEAKASMWLLAHVSLAEQKTLVEQDWIHTTKTFQLGVKSPADLSCVPVVPEVAPPHHQGSLRLLQPPPTLYNHL